MMITRSEMSAHSATERWSLEGGAERKTTVARFCQPSQSTPTTSKVSTPTTSKTARHSTVRHDTVPKLNLPRTLSGQ